MKIPMGVANAMSRKALVEFNHTYDRALRMFISELRSRRIPVISCNNGYCIPDPSSQADVSEAKVYLAKEKARLRTLARRVKELELAIDELEEGPRYLVDYGPSDKCCRSEDVCMKCGECGREFVFGRLIKEAK